MPNTFEGQVHAIHLYIKQRPSFGATLNVKGYHKEPDTPSIKQRIPEIRCGLLYVIYMNSD